MSRLSLTYIGIFSVLISLLSFLNIVYSYYFNLYLNVDSYIPALISSLILGIFFIFKKNKDSKISIYNKIITVILGYLLLPLIISLPYYFSIYNISFINSYFEAISGFTSTGFTIFENIKHYDQSLIIWRSTSQWVGGLYFLFSILLLIDIFDESLKKSLTNFLSFNTSEILKQFFKVFLSYLFLTILIFITLKLINFRNFDAFNFSMTIISSGGFKPVNEFIGLLNNDFKIIMFSITLLISFFSIFLIYNLIFLKGKNLNFFTEDFYLIIYLILLFFLFFVFFNDNNFPLLFFSICSSVSNIGFYFSKFEYDFYFIYLILVIIGGSFFSTSSGVRFFKIFTLMKFSINNLLSHTKPKQVLLSKVIFDSSKINYDVINKYFLSIIIFLMSFSTLSFLLTISGVSFDNSIKLSILTLMNTVNSSLFGLVDFNFFEIHIISKIIFIIFMIIGRVELITILILMKKYLFKI